MRVRILVMASLIMLSLVSLEGCAWWGRNRAPSWIQDPSKQYPPDTYLVGLGRADSAEAAVERAYGAVAKIFKAEVSLQAKDWESFLVLEKRGSSLTERHLTLDQVTRVSTDKVLENAKVLESWQDRRKGTYYALAGINRPQAGTALAERIQNLDQEVEDALKESKDSPDLLTRVKSLRRAIKSLVLREAHNADLRVIRPNGHGLESHYSVSELTARLEDLIRTGLIVQVDLQGDQAEPLRQALIEGLLREGLPVSTAPTSLDSSASRESPDRRIHLLVRGMVKLTKVEVQDPQFQYVRWCTDLKVVDTDSQRVVGAVSGGSREGHLTEEEAKAKAVRVMEEELTYRLVKTLTGFVYGETPPADSTPPAGCTQEGEPH